METNIPDIYDAKPSKNNKVHIVNIRHNIWYDICMPKIIFKTPVNTSILISREHISEFFIRNMPFPRFYIARCEGYNPDTILTKQFLKPSRYIYYKKNKTCCTRWRIYKLPFPDGVYEIQTKRDKATCFRFPKLKVVVFYFQFHNGKMRWISKRTAWQLALGDKYVDVIRKGKYDLEDSKADYPTAS